MIGEARRLRNRGVDRIDPDIGLEVDVADAGAEDPGAAAHVEDRSVIEVVAVAGEDAVPSQLVDATQVVPVTRPAYSASKLGRRARVPPPHTGRRPHGSPPLAARLRRAHPNAPSDARSTLPCVIDEVPGRAAGRVSTPGGRPAHCGAAAPSPLRRRAPAGGCRQHAPRVDARWHVAEPLDRVGTDEPDICVAREERAHVGGLRADRDDRPSNADVLEQLARKDVAIRGVALYVQEGGALCHRFSCLRGGHHDHRTRATVDGRSDPQGLSRPLAGRAHEDETRPGGEPQDRRVPGAPVTCPRPSRRYPRRGSSSEHCRAGRLAAGIGSNPFVMTLTRSGGTSGYRSRSSRRCDRVVTIT